MVRPPLLVLRCLAIGATVGTALLSSGCLPDDPAVQGRLLYGGVGIERPEFRRIDGQPWVMFDVRRTRAVHPQGGTVDLHIVNWETGESRLILAGRSDRPEWSRNVDGEGAYLYMIDERQTNDGRGAAVGTLVRVRLADGEILERIPDVISYSLQSDRKRMHYRKYVPGSQYPELHLYEIGGRDRNLGLLTGQVQSMGSLLYYISGEESVLTRINGFDGEPERLRSRVSQFLFQEGQRLGVVTVSEKNVVKKVVFDLETRTERPMPVPNPCCTIQLVDRTYIFASAARGDDPAELHYYNIETEVDRKLALPQGLLDVRTMMRRPPSARGEYLLFDVAQQTALFQTRPDFAAAMTPLSPRVPGFTDDGRYLIFIDPDPLPPPPAMTTVLTGRLYVQDMDRLDLPPRLLSPRGASVPLDPVGYKLRPTPEFPLLFWARFGLGGSDLYISDYETGASEKVAQGIGAVHVSDRHVLGVVRITQDLSGDLVYRNFKTGQENLVEHGVTDVQVFGEERDGVFRELVAFVVRERMTGSRRNGLWATLLPPAPPDPPADDATAAARVRVSGIAPLRQWVRVEGGEPIPRPQ